MGAKWLRRREPRLDQLRAIFPTTTSILMDLDTLLAHRTQWVCEMAPTSRSLEQLNPEESALYRDLVEDRYGHHVRLEQERVRFRLVRRALARWSQVRLADAGGGRPSDVDALRVELGMPDGVFRVDDGAEDDHGETEP